MTGPDDVTRRLGDAVRAEAAGVAPDEDAALATIRARGRAARRRRQVVLAAGGVAAVVAVALAVPALDTDRQQTVTTGATTSVPDEEAPDGTTGTSVATPGPTEFNQPPLWPFRSFAEVEEWQADHAASGSQPWHLDAEETALAFTTGFLGFTDVDQVVDSEIGATDAYVTVGYDLPEGGLAAAAVVHLVRFGGGDDAPWEVVGTRDERLTLERPEYGATVATPLTVGGVVTGVDESLRVEVRQPSSAAPIGESCCVPAGGERTPWEATVSFSGATDPALTVVVSTGGHVQDVEAFAITAIRH